MTGSPAGLPAGHDAARWGGAAAAAALVQDAAAQIASGLGISARTVQTHLARAYAKLGIHDRRDLPRALSLDGLPAQGKR